MRGRDQQAMVGKRMRGIRDSDDNGTRKKQERRKGDRAEKIRGSGGGRAQNRSAVAGAAATGGRPEARPERPPSPGPSLQVWPLYPGAG